MKVISAEEAVLDFERLIDRVNQNCESLAITCENGRSAVLIGEDEWSAIEETLYLNGIPGMADSIVDGMKTPISESFSEDKMDWQAVWKVVFTKQAIKDAKKLKAAGLDVKAKSLIEVVKDNPLANPPAYEALRGNLEGSFSRRINLQHRFVYEVVPGVFEENVISFDGTVKVVRMQTHFEKSIKLR